MNAKRYSMTCLSPTRSSMQVSIASQLDTIRYDAPSPTYTTVDPYRRRFTKAKLAYPQYYHNALLFLSSVSLDELTDVEKQERAFELAISALLGEGLYNFGELVGLIRLEQKDRS